MKAIVQHRYGSIDDLELREIERPAVAADEVLRAMGAGLRRPKQPVPGTDVGRRGRSSGVSEAAEPVDGRALLAQGNAVLRGPALAGP
jgi:hypothetical protein